MVAHLRTMHRRGAIPIETVAYSLTYFRHMIQAMTETAPRLPARTPRLDFGDAPERQIATGILILILIFIVSARSQLRCCATLPERSNHCMIRCSNGRHRKKNGRSRERPF